MNLSWSKATELKTVMELLALPSSRRKNLCLDVLRLKIRDKASLAGGLRHLTWHIGQIEGCIKYRYFPV